MLFNSIEFAIFLPLVFLLYWFVFNRNLKWQNAFIVVVSYIFYGWWDWRFLLLMAFTTFCSYGSGRFIQRKKEDGSHKAAKWMAAANITVNLLILGLFKYFNFFVHSFIDLFSLFGITLHATTLNLILPVGISFYTFQALSYTIDVYRGKIEATKDVVTFFAFVCFFPQLVAGPIERATNLLPQFKQPRRFSYADATDGCRQILWGLFKKMVVADNCAILADRIFANSAQQSGGMLFAGALFFTFQIYGDFSGYSDIAIGTSKLFGIKLMRNFNIPYFSRDIAEFWRRWHISLNSWFRDYIYIPLGGSRVSKAKVVRNTFIIFLLSGLWHGANWTFIAWGAYHAVLFLPLILLNKNRKYVGGIAENRLLPSLKEFGSMLVTFVLVVIGWIFFRADDIAAAGQYIASLFTADLWKAPYYFLTAKSNFVGLFVILMLVVEWLTRNRQHGLDFVGIKNRPVKWAIYLAIALLAIEFQPQEIVPFIYFQF